MTTTMLGKVLIQLRESDRFAARAQPAVLLGDGVDCRLGNTEHSQIIDGPLQAVYPMHCERNSIPRCCVSSRM